MHARPPMLLLLAFAAVLVSFGLRPLTAAADAPHRHATRQHHLSNRVHDRGATPARKQRHTGESEHVEATQGSFKAARALAPAAAFAPQRGAGNPAPPLSQGRRAGGVVRVTGYASRPSSPAQVPPHTAPLALPPQPVPPPVVGFGGMLVAPVAFPAIAGSSLPLSLSLATALALALCTSLAGLVLVRSRGTG